MKKILTLLMTALFSLSLASFVLADEPVKDDAQKTEMKAEKKEKKEKKGKKSHKKSHKKAKKEKAEDK